MNIENENSFRVALAEGFNLFVGAGFSVFAKDADDNELPLGGDLTKELGRVFNISSADKLDLPKICTIIESTKKDELTNYLRRRYTVVSFDDRYKVLDKLKVKNIFTTNIDDLLYKIYTSSTNNYLNDIDLQGPAYKERHAVDLVTLHGSVHNQSRGFVFSVSDLATAFASDPDKWHFLSGRLQLYPTLFWGYSLSDAGILQTLSPTTSGGRPLKEKWIVLHPRSVDDASIDYFSALGFSIIEADTSEMLDYLNAVAPTLNASIPPSDYDTRSLFPDEAIPELGSYIVRPIVEFYLGAAPQWSDIFSNQIHRTSHLRSILESINASRHTLIVGIPACGKTTLLMQAAAEATFHGHKLVSGSITIDKAHFIVNVLNGVKALIFHDNFADSLEGFEYLVTQPNIQLVCAERDYNFEIASHRVTAGTFNVIDVTSLRPSDVQSCLQHIPEAIRKPLFLIPVADGDTAIDRYDEPSIFEIIEDNITEPTLRERFDSVISQLNKENPILRDLLIMICYVSMCRAPTSIDMLLAYYRDHAFTYDAITEMLRQTGSIVAEYKGVVPLDLEQDYFVPRSVIAAETVIQYANNEMLKEMLVRFHNNVTPYRIYRYDVFRRYGYDNKIFSRAFTEAQEGKDFYEKLYARDGSPYLLQHAALYLLRKKRYPEAFFLIDKAVNESGGKVWSINNSRAIIMFRANIEHYAQEDARRQLRNSLEILIECYTWDRRKPHHAATFADEAIQYFDVYGDGDAYDYLNKAYKWLQAERRNFPWNRRIRYLLPKVKERLGV